MRLDAHVYAYRKLSLHVYLRSLLEIPNSRQKSNTPEKTKAAVEMQRFFGTARVNKNVDVCNDYTSVLLSDTVPCPSVGQ